MFAITRGVERDSQDPISSGDTAENTRASGHSSARSARENSPDLTISKPTCALTLVKNPTSVHGPTAPSDLHDRTNLVDIWLCIEDTLRRIGFKIPIPTLQNLKQAGGICTHSLHHVICKVSVNLSYIYNIYVLR